MIPVKTFDATGVAPNGKLYAGDLNAIEAAAAGLSDFTQTIDLGTLRIGETALQLLRYGASEARLTGAFRTDGILRALGGSVDATMDTTTRNALPVNAAPYGLKILNTTTNRVEMNVGTDVARVWKPVALDGAGSLAIDNILYFNDVSLSRTSAKLLTAAGMLGATRGVVHPVYTTAGRDAIPAGERPRGMTIFNSDILALETNIGSDAIPVWSGGAAAVGDYKTVAMSAPGTAGISEPQSGWLYCNGAAVSRVTYAALFAKIGILFGAGDTINTFNLPDFRGREMLAMLDTAAGGGTRATGATLGAVLGVDTVTLTVPQIPDHTHPDDFDISPNPHAHALPLPAISDNSDVLSAYIGGVNGRQLIWATNNTLLTLTGGVGNTGGGLAHENKGPSLVGGIVLIKY